MNGFVFILSFGSHLKINDKKIKKNHDLVIRILNKYCELGYHERVTNYLRCSKKFLFKVVTEIDNFISSSKNKEFWQIFEEFNFKNRQRKFIKNNPSFNLFGKYNSFSIFLDPALIDFLMTIPFNKRLNQKIYFYYFKRKLPVLYNIRPERDISLKYKNRIFRNILLKIFKFLIHFKIINKSWSHKELHKWLSNDKGFIGFLGENLLSNRNLIFDNIFQHENVKDLINKNNWDQFEISIIFRLLTIKCFLDEFIL
ncbi:hypothetical protein LCGC14_1994510 [marine sediment metagenome]|uniref:Uncharacterized protein n=1 Tax=marine sediment metagenome TaxID=412755 RepID=A0A0F9F5B2_9ZZZZ